MHLVHLGRREGKTLLVVDWVKKGTLVSTFLGWTRVILVATLHEKLNIIREYELHIKQIYTYAEWQDLLQNSPVKPFNVEVVIDNIDDYVRQTIGQYNVLKMVTLNKE